MSSYFEKKEKSIIVMITSRCNMSCKHCAVSADKNGIDMSLEVFQKTCEKLKKVKDLHKICLSGGEPTLHPEFWQFIRMALETGHGLQITTNGSKHKDALRLTNYAKKGRLEERWPGKFVQLLK